MQVRFHLGMRCFQLISGRDGADKGRFRGGCVQMDAPGIQGFMEGGHRGLRSSGKSKRDPFDCVPRPRRKAARRKKAGSLRSG